MKPFLYFAYGSYMLERIMIANNPSAEFISIGRLDNFRLAFTKYSRFWGGPPVTMVPTANAHIWGVIWRINDDMGFITPDNPANDASTDGTLRYFPISSVPILTPYMGTFMCRAQQQRYNPLPRGDNDAIPIDQHPSKSYKEVMILGAVEHGLPQYYIDSLEERKDNGEEGGFPLAEFLKTYSHQKPCLCIVPGRIPRKHLKLDMNKKRAEEKSFK